MSILYQVLTITGIFMGFFDSSEQHIFINECESAFAQFKNDVAIDSVKYYSFGMLPTSLSLKSHFIECCNIYLIDLGCVPSNYEVCYNANLVEYFHNKTGKNIKDAFLEKD